MDTVVYPAKFHSELQPPASREGRVPVAHPDYALGRLLEGVLAAVDALPGGDGGSDDRFEVTHRSLPEQNNLHAIFITRQADGRTQLVKFNPNLLVLNKEYQKLLRAVEAVLRRFAFRIV